MNEFLSVTSDDAKADGAGTGAPTNIPLSGPLFPDEISPPSRQEPPSPPTPAKKKNTKNPQKTK